MQQPLRNWLLLLVIGFVWGSSFILMKKGLLVFTGPQMAALRMGLAWLITIPMLLPRIREIGRKEWLVLCSVGMLGSGIPAFLFAIAQQTMESAFAGMMNSLVPILTLLFGLALFGLRTWYLQVLGLLLGLVGAYILILFPNGFSGIRPDAILVLIASSCYAFNLNMVKRFLPKMPSVLITSASFLWIGPPCIVYLFSTDFLQLTSNPDFVLSFSAIAVLAAVGTALAVLMFNRLIQEGGPLFASMVTYIVPVFAVMWGIIDGENINSWQLLGVVVILLGVYLVNRRVTDRS